MAVNVFIGIHGMLTASDYVPQGPNFEAFFRRLVKEKPDLEARFGNPPRWVWPEWGQDLPGEVVRADHKLRIAEANLARSLDPDSVEPEEREPRAKSPADSIWNLAASGISELRRTVMLNGITDVIYYASEGELPIRASVYEKVSDYVMGVSADAPSGEVVRLHIVAHSLGATIAHDFLYGLFNSKGESDFAKGRGKLHEAARKAYKALIQLKTDGQLELGSFVTMGCQVGLMVTRKQLLVDRFFENGSLDPADIGISMADSDVWHNFYDADDILGYPVRGVYGNSRQIKDYEVNCGQLAEVPFLRWFGARTSHVGYMTHDSVIRRAAELIEERSRLP